MVGNQSGVVNQSSTVRYIHEFDSGKNINDLLVDYTDA